MSKQPSPFKVTFSTKRPPYWEVTHTDGRWWSVAYHAEMRELYVITNGRGQRIDPHGPTGQRVLDAVHDFERNTVIA